MDILLRKPPFKAFLLGNEAISRGAIEAEVKFASTYPGTPASEIGDSIYKIASEAGIHFEYAVNEKVALEMAIGASLLGKRSLISMKHVGLNVASDSLMTFAYIGVRAGVVIVSADDPFCHSSQNEQDNRYYAIFSNLPMLEPSNPEEARVLTKLGFKISEEYGVPVILRITTRCAHSRGIVNYEEPEEHPEFLEFKKNPLKYVVVPAVARVLHREHIKKMEKLTSEITKFNLNKIKINGNKGIVSSGVSRNYVKESINFYNLQESISLYELLFTYPFSEKEIVRFLTPLREVFVVEELEPIIENAFQRIAFKNGLKVKILGKKDGFFPYAGEFSPEIVEQSISKFLSLKEKQKREIPLIELPSRPPVLCPGCPHRATYTAVKITTGDDAIFPTDIGCYTLGINPPLEMADILVCMGSSISIGSAFSLFSKKKIVSFIGDSTFFHAGLAPLMNALHHKHKFLLVIMDNQTTAMTGFQPHPGSTVKIEDIVKSAGAGFAKVVDPFNFVDTLNVIKSALEYDGLSVVISRSPCVLLEKKEREFFYTVDKKLCKTCGNSEAGCHCGIEIIKEHEKFRILSKIERNKKEKEIFKTAPCSGACPVKLCAQGYIALISEGKFSSAYELIRKRIPFPSVCAYICHAPCESACFNTAGEKPVAIRELKKIACIFGKKEGIVKKGERRGIEVAIVGSGPSSLTVAHDLTLLGYDCTIFEKSESLGGLLSSVIPEFRLPKKIVEDEINEILSLGIKVKKNIEIGKDIKISELFSQNYKAIFIGTGLSDIIKLEIKGVEFEGVIEGIEFLKKNKKGEEIKVGENVIVIGGGNTAFDCARAALRQGGKNIKIVYRRTKNEMPAIIEEFEDALMEGIEFLELLSPLEIKARDGKVCEVLFQKMELSSPDESGRRKPVEKKGETLSLKTDTLIIAIGQYSKDGFLKVNPLTMMTEKEGIFAGGDIIGGNATVIDAIAGGKRAALGIHAFLTGEKIEEDLYFPSPQIKTKTDKIFEKFTKFKGQEIENIEELKIKAIFEARRCIQCGLCKNCNVCIDFLGCPAISKTNGEIFIDNALCTDCGICTIICPNEAIKKVEI